MAQTEKVISCIAGKCLYGRISGQVRSDGSVQPPYALSCPSDNSLLRADYTAKRLDLADLPGMWKFYDWLPVKGIIQETCEGCITYKSEGLAVALGLKNLFISFNGYWPEKRARMQTCSFKDLEAPPTMQRQKEQENGSILVVASAGNTARAFAQVASITRQPLVLFVPKRALHRVWITVEKGPITLLSVKGDYYDAIAMAEKVQSRTGFVPEGEHETSLAEMDGHDHARRNIEDRQDSGSLLPGCWKRYGWHICLGSRNAIDPRWPFWVETAQAPSGTERPQCTDLLCIQVSRSRVRLR